MKDKIQLVVVGSIGIDDISTPLEQQEKLLGGSASYACAAASYYATTGMIGVVGDDFPEAFVERYRRLGIDLRGLQRAEGATFHWSGAYEDDMINRRTLRTDLGVFGDFRPRTPDEYRDAPFVFLGNIGPRLQLRVLESMRSPKFVAIDTMDLWIQTQRDDLLKVIERCDLLTLNDAEARQLTGRHGLRECAERMMAMGPQWVVIKKGEHGAILFSRDSLFLVPAYPVAVVRDPTGAGDSFAGGCMGWLARGDAVADSSLRAALVRGSVLASFGVEAFSLERLETLHPDEIEKRLAEIRDMVDFSIR